MVRISSILALLSAVVFLVAPAQGSKSSSKACGAEEFSYAGLQADQHGARRPHDDRAARRSRRHRRPRRRLDRRRRRRRGPRRQGRVAPDRLASFAPTTRSTSTTRSPSPARPDVPRAQADVQPGEKHDFAVLEMRGRNSWWRVWVDGKPVSEADPPPAEPRQLVPAGPRRELERRHGHLQLLRVPLLERQARARRTAAPGSR